MARSATLFVAVALLITPLAAFAHPGGTDKFGCHTNKKTGDYHCHGSKTPAPTEPSKRSSPSTAASPSTSTSATYFTPAARVGGSETKLSTSSGTKPSTSTPSADLIRVTQTLLKILGYQVEANGVMTSATRTAIDMAQRQEKLPTTGVPDEALLVRISQRVAEHVKKRCW